MRMEVSLSNQSFSETFRVFVPLLAAPLLAALLLLALLAGCAPAQTPAENALVLEACRLPGGESAECGTLTVFENRESGSGHTIDLKIAVVRARTNTPEPDPLFLLAGGPGQAAIETFAPILPLLDDITEKRDIVLVDQRGTGDSGALECANLEDAEPDLSDEAFFDLIAECRAELAQQLDLSQYVTEIAMQDLDEVRAALGYEQINLYGGSYGTRAALTYMRRYPGRVRSAILDAVVSPELVLNYQAPRDGQRALELLFERCQNDEACRAQFPEFESEFGAVLERLENELPLELRHPITAEALELDLGRDDLTGLVYAMLYSPDMLALLPLLVHDAQANADLAPLVAQGMVAAERGLYLGMFYSVACSEDAPLIELEQARALQEGTVFPLMAENFLTVCAEWPKASLPGDFRAALGSDIPTVLLSGAADPVTPPQYAEQVAAGLRNSLHLVLPGQGHGQLFSGCMPQVARRFIEAGSVDSLETACLDELQPPPFFVDFTGPRP